MTHAPAICASIHTYSQLSKREPVYMASKIWHSGNTALKHPSYSFVYYHILEHLLHSKSPLHLSTGDAANALLSLGDIKDAPEASVVKGL